MDARAAAFVHYYAREGYLQHVQSVCNELIKHASTPVVQFWRAYGLLASGATAEVSSLVQMVLFKLNWSQSVKNGNLVILLSAGAEGAVQHSTRC